MSMAATDIETMISETFVLVEASKLRTNDDFMKHKPKTYEEEKFKKRLTEVIENGVKDFWRPKYDPSFTKEGKGICYMEGKKPAVEKSYNWWKKTAEAFCPRRHSRLGTKSEYVAFLGVLIKKLVESGWDVAEAWSAVCNDSRNLGYYWDSTNADNKLENTGSREVCGFFDIANTYKILADDEEKPGYYWRAGCHYTNNSFGFALANFSMNINHNFVDFCGVGWVVIPA